MKKTLLALSVAAFAVTASAATVYEKDGTKLSLDGKLYGSVKNYAKKDQDTEKQGQKDLDTTKKRNSHTELEVAGGELSATVTHDLANGVKLEGTGTFSSNGFNTSTLALSKDKLGTLTFGDVDSAGYSVGSSAAGYGVEKTSNSVRYDNSYAGVSYFATYSFPKDRDDRGEVKFQKLANSYDFGLKSAYRGLSYGLAFGRANYVQDKVTDNSVGKYGVKHFKHAFSTYVSYKLPFAQKVTHKTTVNYVKERNRQTAKSGTYVNSRFTYAVNSKTGVTFGYNYSDVLTDVSALHNQKVRTNGLHYSVYYYPHPSVYTYLSGSFSKTRTFADQKTTYNNDSQLRLKRNAKTKQVKVGVEVYF